MPGRLAARKSAREAPLRQADLPVTSAGPVRAPGRPG